MAEPQAEPAVESYASKLQTAQDALDDGAFGFAKKLLTAIYNDQTSELGADKKPKPARPIVVQRLALATYKAGEATGDPDKALAGYAEAERLLSQLDVETTTDPETLGQWSAIHKKRAQMPGRTTDEIKADVAEAIQASERGFLIKRDYYNGTNLAYLFNLRASMSSGDDRIADNVFAARVRRMVVKIAEDPPCPSRCAASPRRFGRSEVAGGGAILGCGLARGKPDRAWRPDRRRPDG